MFYTGERSRTDFTCSRGLRVSMEKERKGNERERYAFPLASFPIIPSDNLLTLLRLIGSSIGRKRKGAVSAICFQHRFCFDKRV